MLLKEIFFHYRGNKIPWRNLKSKNTKNYSAEHDYKYVDVIQGID
jgi:hypothetical protein